MRKIWKSGEKNMISLKKRRSREVRETVKRKLKLKNQKERGKKSLQKKTRKASQRKKIKKTRKEKVKERNDKNIFISNTFS